MRVRVVLDRMFLVGFDDHLHELVPDDVLLGEIDELDPLETARIVSASLIPLFWPRGRSICVRSPVTTAFEPNPIRVRNIFICSLVVFWASSRMIKASDRVRPRINASGAISMIRFSSIFVTFSAVDQVKQSVIETDEDTDRPFPADRRARIRAAHRPRPPVGSG